MLARPQRKTGNLHHGRISLPGARYWITCSAVRPTTCLITPACGTTLISVVHSFEESADLRLLCSTVMPDHMHVLFELGHRLTVGQIIGKFKFQTREAVRFAGASWQRDCFEHRLRPEEATNDFARYAFLNPYRAGIISRQSDWPYWQLGRGITFDFQAMLEAGRFPPAEWLSTSSENLGLQADFLGEA